MRRLVARPTLIIGALVFVWSFSLTILAGPPRHRQHHDDHHHHPEAQKLKNPVPPVPESIDAGQKLFIRHCSECHGDEGKGDGMGGEGLEPPPANLTDDEWKHGTTDGELFTVIRDGTPNGMKKFGSKFTARQIWDLVNYVRTLGRRRDKPEESSVTL